MSFVAQPYEQFVDDLLTALTGGVVREEHRFTGVEEPYRLATPGIIPASLKVFGQQNEAFTFFEPRIAYQFDANEESIIWNADAILPDEQSFFYVNYYVREGVKRLTDRNPGSVTTTLAEAFAREYAVLHKQMEMIYRSAFVDLAEGSALDQVVALLSLTRRDARFAQGEILFKRSSPAQGDITIASGTQISTDLGEYFETTEKRTLRKGQLAVAVPIRAQQEGASGKVDVGAIVNVNRPIFGIESIIQEKATFFSTEKETDEELRRRMKSTLERAGKSTLNAIRFGLIEAIPEIDEGNIQVLERPGSPGKVDVRLGLESTDDAALIQRVEQAIFESRPAGVRVEHNLPTRSASIDEAGAGDQDTGSSGARNDVMQLPADVLDGLPDGILPLQAYVTLRLSEQNLTVTQKEQIEDAVRTFLVDYVSALPMGEELIFNKMLAVVFEEENVLDASLSIGVKGASMQEKNLDTSGRKAQLQFQDIQVQLMEELVHVDVKVNLISNPGTEVTGELTADLDLAIKEILQNAINSASGSLEQRTLLDAVREFLGRASQPVPTGREQRGCTQCRI